MSFPNVFTRRRALELIGGTLAFTPAIVSAQPTPTVPSPDIELRVRVQGGSIYVRLNGRANGPRKPLLMIHGGPGGNHGVFVPALPLAQDRMVILYDQLDCGRSDQPNDPANWTVARFGSEIESIRRALGIEAWHVLGHSWGAALALEYAAKQPKALKSLILQGPLVSTRRWLEDAARLRAKLPKDIQAAILRHESAGTYDSPEYQQAIDAFYARYWQREPVPAHVAAYVKTLPVPFNKRLYETMWGPSEFACTGTLATYDGEPLLAQVKVPTLFLTGEYDEAMPDTCRDFAKRVRQADVAVVAGAGHRIQTDRTQAYLDVLRRRLAAYD